MKAINICLAALIIGLNAMAADGLTERLQRGLFEEEANHNLDAAIKEYQALVTQADEQRKVIATALFRLGECYRKLGRTNEATAFYQRIMRDFAEQEQLARLAGDLLKPANGTASASSQSPVVREMERRLALLRTESILQRVEYEKLFGMSREELARSFYVTNDAAFAALQQQLLATDQRLVTLQGRGLGDGNPEVVATQNLHVRLLEQESERLKAIVAASQNKSDLLVAPIKALEAELARTKASENQPVAVAPSWKTVTEPEQVRLLQEEIKLAEQQVAAMEKNHAAGVEPLAAVLNARREVLAIRRLLPENSSLPRQKALLDEQVKIVEQLLKETNERVRVGVVPTTEAIPLRRELLSLQREMAGLTEAAATNAATDSAPATMTQAEREELARVMTLAKNSPDLLQSPGDPNGFSQLQSAASKGYYYVVEFILSQGVNANGLERGSPPLLLAASAGHLRIVQLLLDKGANVNAATTSGRTALMSACENGFRSVVEVLLERGADVNRADNDETTALHLAALKGRTGVAELLLKRNANPNALSRRQSQSLSTQGSYLYGATPLHLAVDGGYVTLAELLLKSGANANATNTFRTTPLHLTAKAGDTNISALLLDGGADPNVEDGYNYTPLIRAIETGRPEVVALLLARGADVNRAVTNSNRYFYYPLHIAIAKNLEVLTALLAAKPNLEVVNGSQNTPLLQAIVDKRGEIALGLLEAGANPNRMASDGSTPLYIAVSQTPPSPSLVAALLRRGADPNIRNKYGSTPLSFALGRSEKESGVTKGDLKQIESLLRENGANEYLQRLSGITYTRPTWTAADKNVFYRGTNDYNRYTLFEFLAGIFGNRDAPPFPDLARVTVERLEGSPPKPKEISINIEQLLRSDDCTKDMAMEWGDRVSFPELDHPLNENWAGLSPEVREFLSRCLTRWVQIVVKRETNTVKLMQNMSGQPQLPPMAPLPAGVSLPTAIPRPIPPTAIATPGFPAGESVPPKEKTEKVLQTFRLKDVVYFANVLRASSDPTRVRVIRREGNKTNEWVIDLTKVATNNEWNTPGSPNVQSTKLWPQHDLWLRDGDVIEVPEKQ